MIDIHSTLIRSGHLICSKFAVPKDKNVILRPNIIQDTVDISKSERDTIEDGEKLPDSLKRRIKQWRKYITKLEESTHDQLLQLCKKLVVEKYSMKDEIKKFITSEEHTKNESKQVHHLKKNLEELKERLDELSNVVSNDLKLNSRAFEEKFDYVVRLVNTLGKELISEDCRECKKNELNSTSGNVRICSRYEKNTFHQEEILLKNIFFQNISHIEKYTDLFKKVHIAKINKFQ